MRVNSGLFCKVRSRSGLLSHQFSCPNHAPVYDGKSTSARCLLHEKQRADVFRKYCQKSLLRHEEQRLSSRRPAGNCAGMCRFCMPFGKRNELNCVPYHNAKPARPQSVLAQRLPVARLQCDVTNRVGVRRPALPGLRQHRVADCQTDRTEHRYQHCKPACILHFAAPRLNLRMELKID